MNLPEGILVVTPREGGPPIDAETLKEFQEQLKYLLESEQPDPFILVTGADVYFVPVKAPTTVEAQLMSGILTINEAREQMGLPPADWGDKPLGYGVKAWWSDSNG